MYSKETISMHFNNPLPGIPSVESPFFSKIFSDPSVSEDVRRVATQLRDNGFAVIDFPDDDFDHVAEAIKANLHDKYDWANWGDGSLRLMNAWEFDQNVRRIATNEKVINLLSQIFGRQAWPFQTLNFPVGTQQPPHSDSVHFSSVPERFMCGVWTALEDIDEDAGPLVYYPGSHKWPIYSMEHIGVCALNAQRTIRQDAFEPAWQALVEQHGVEPHIFRAKKGQSLIWLANLLHGGISHKDRSKTRWSQVTHYFFNGCAYWIPMHSDPFYGNIVFREFRNVVTGEMVKNEYLGNRIPEDFIHASQTRRYDEKPSTVPSFFDPSLYLQANPDVAAAGMDAAQHYLSHGWKERRPLAP
jgi:hypothetical protein